MGPTPTSRPQAKQYRSSGWAWPLLVNVQVQRDKPTHTKRQPKSPKHASAKPSMRDLRKSRDLTHLRDEQSEPTSPLHGPASPRDSSAGGHGIEECEDYEADEEYDAGRGEDAPQDVPLPEEVISESEDGRDENLAGPTDTTALVEGSADEPETHRGEHVENEPRNATATEESAHDHGVHREEHDSHGSEPEAPAQKTSDEPYIHREGHSKHESSHALSTEEPTSERERREEGYVKHESPRESPVKESANQPKTRDEEYNEGTLENPNLAERSPQQSEVQDGKHDERPKNHEISEDTEPGLVPVEQLLEPSPITPGDSRLPEDHSAMSKDFSPEPTLETATFNEAESKYYFDRYPGLIQAGLIPVEAKKSERPRKPPIITIQRPSNSEVSDSDDEMPAAPLPTPEPQPIDVVLSEGRYVSKRLPLQDRLEEERRITSELTANDRERIVQEIATNIASLEPAPPKINPPRMRSLRQNMTLPGNLGVKRRTKVRGKVVRSPVLKLLLGRQLAGPIGKALKLGALGKAVPAVPAIPAVPDIPDVTNPSGWPNPLGNS